MYHHPRDATMAPQIREDMPQRKGAFLRRSTDPWRRPFPRGDIPRTKEVYPRGTMRARQWQERRHNREDHNECSQPSLSPINREPCHQKKTNALNPSKIVPDISIMKRRIVSNIRPWSTMVDPCSTMVDHGRPMIDHCRPRKTNQRFLMIFEGSINPRNL